MKNQTTLALLLPVVLAAGACKSAEPPRDQGVIRAEAESLGVKNGRAPFPGIMTAGQLTDEQFRALVDSGYRTFVNLRPADEEGTGWEEDLAAGLGVRFVRIPIAGAPDVTEANARRLSQTLEGAAGPTVVYCGSSNRVGALFALEAYYVDGRGPEEALEVGKAAGVTRLEPKVRELLGLPAGE